MSSFQRTPGRLRRGLLAVVAGVFALVPAANAEVRLQKAKGDQHVVQVRQTDRGVWSPVGPINGGVLNPEGDLIADGPPTVQEGASAFVAWHRPSRSSIRVARGQGGVWRTLADFRTPGPAGSPLLVPSGEQAIATWTVHGATPETWVAGTASSESSALELRGHVALDAWLSGSQLMLTTFEPSWGGRGDIVINVIINPIEEPELVQSVVLDHDVSLSVASLTRRIALPGSGGAEALTWWPTPQLLRVVELRAGAPLLPVREHVKEQGGDYSPALWNEAIRSLRKERD